MEKHFATSGFIMNHDRTKVLMVHHKKLNTWVIPGGHLEPNEYPAVGACREVLEETGVHASIYDSSNFEFELDGREGLIATPYMTLSESIPAKGDKPAHIHMDFIFLGEADDTLPLKEQESEVDSVKWMTYQEVIDSDAFDSIKQIALLQLDWGAKKR